MKTNFVAICLFAIILTAKCESSEESSEYSEQLKALKSHKMYSEAKKYCNFDEETLLNETIKLGECITGLNWNMTVCSLYQSQIPDCIEPYLKTFESCVKGTGADLPRFIKDIFVASTKYICTVSGESVMEIFNFCTFEDSKYDDEITQKFISSFEKFKEGEELPSKSHVCTFFTETKTLFVDAIHDTCYNPVTRKFHEGLIDAIISTCDGENEIK